MSLEDANYISQLQKDDPARTDLVSQGDDHLRLIKKVLQNSFEPAIDSALIPDITDKEDHVLAVNDAADGIIWKSASEITGSNYFRYWKSSPQTVYRDAVRVTYDVMKEDPDSVWVTNTWTIGVAGIYHIDAYWRVVEAAIPDHDMMIRINGESYKKLSYTDYGASTTKFFSMQISADFMADPGDVIDIAGSSESEMAIIGSSNVLAGVSGYRIR